MSREIYAFKFAPEVDMQDASEALLLAAAAAEGLHGRSRIHLEAGFRCDPRARTAEVTAGTEVGDSIARIFIALLTTTVGEETFHVEHIAQDGPA